MKEQIRINTYFGIDELNKRLRNVQLKGFPNIKIYDGASIQIRSQSPEEIRQDIFVPQPTVYRNGFLDRIDELAELFAKQGIDIFHLQGGIDYTFFSNGIGTEWTIIPPIIEILPINFTNGRLNYYPWLSPQLQKTMEQTECKLNPDLIKLSFPEYPCSGLHQIPIICDGSHRVHSGLEKGISQNTILIDRPKDGFPYYAAPQPYSIVHVEKTRPEKGANTKIHILESPAHKSLYRLFPTGGILNGTVRPE